MSANETANKYKVIFWFCTTLITSLSLEAYCIYCTWDWFITPLGLPSISLAHGLGLSIFVNIFKSRKSDSSGNDIVINWTTTNVMLKDATQRLVNLWISKFMLIIGLGWVCSRFL